MLLNKSSQLSVLVHALSRGGSIYLDLETTGTNPLLHKIVSVAILVPREYVRDKVYIVDCREMDLLEVGRILGPALKKCIVIGQNIKFDLSFLSYQCGIELTDVADTMILEQVLQGRGFGSGTSFSLEDIAKRRGLKISKQERSWFIDLDQRDEWNQPLPAVQLRYAEQDVRILDKLYPFMWEEIEKQGLKDCAELECAVIPCLADVQITGIRVDQERLLQVVAEEQIKFDQLEQKCMEVFGPHIMLAREPIIESYKEEIDAYKSALEQEEQRLRERYREEKGWGEYKKKNLREWREQNPRPTPIHLSEVNISSSFQVKQALKYMRPDLLIEDANKETLEELVGEIPEIQYLLDMRKSQKIITTYGQNLIDELDENSRLHSEYIQLKDTSRMAARRIQQIPSHGVLGQKIRQCFIPAPGHKFVIGDYSQQEARIAAELSNCSGLLKLFREQKDIYTETARQMFNLSEDVDVRKEQFIEGFSYRDISKRVFLGLMYGLSAYGLAAQLGIEVEQAENLMVAFFYLYPETRVWKEKQAEFALKHFYIKTDAGWRRTFDPLPELDYCRGPWVHPTKEERQQYKRAINRIKRQAGNTRIQGLGAAITKRTLVQAYQIKKSYMKCAGIIHDEFIFEAPEEYAEETRAMLSSAMDYGSRYYLKKVYIPPTECFIADYWRKD